MPNQMYGSDSAGFTKNKIHNFAFSTDLKLLLQVKGV
jgi:hypothetical protein